jgi:hypothetical protein
MTLRLETAPTYANAGRRGFIGGSDARIIMGTDEPALVRLWWEKRGEAEPPDYSDNLLVQLGLATEPLNRRWFEPVIKDVQRWGPPAAVIRPLPRHRIAEKEPRSKTQHSRYFRRGCRGFRSSTPSSKPFALLKAIPARSKAFRIAVIASSDTFRRFFSKSTTVESPRPAASASWD